ncbi:uncharacterized protein Bfra_011828 [Botrytis fragariae]|uniref:Uncharacterized protein n=1 Tax=Botrytis fragariae TaxID=1964551 RepID=A0A8H6EE81_9HELO|nr:uncharacterized protein Bfra_011828 [Botrytis fragariae]KAF5868863.1 hypothetical protein Bfra_011828 [Botrytis fragariae]
MTSATEYVHGLLNNWARTVVLNDPSPDEDSFGASLGFMRAEYEKDEIAKTGRGFGNAQNRDGGRIFRRSWAAGILQNTSRAAHNMFRGDIEDAVAFHHQASAKQKNFIHDNSVCIPELLQLCSFITDKPYIEELRGLSEQRQWRQINL